MPTDAEVIAFLVKVEGDEKAKTLAASVALAQQKFDSLYASLGKGDAATRAAASQLLNLKSKLDAVGGGAGKTGQLLMQAGYAADDLQYGFKGIANNIQPILQQIPALGAMAPVLSIAAIAAYQLYEHWDQVQGLLGMGLPQPALTGPELLAKNLKKASDEMEELLKKTTLTWQEVAKLKDLKFNIAGMKKDEEAGKAVEAATKGQSDAEKAAGGGYAKAMAESGGQDAQDELLGKLRDNKDAKGLVYNEAKGKMDTPENAARDMSAAALAGDKISRDAIAALLENGSRFKANIQKFSPERKAKDEQNERVKEAEDDAAEDIKVQEKADQKTALDKGEKALSGTGADARIEDALLRSALKSGGKTGVASKEVAEQLSRELQSKGLSKAEADASAKDQVEKRAGKLGDEVNEGALKPKDRDKLEAPTRIASADFARSVEGAGASAADKLQTTTEAMKEKLTDLVRLVQQGPILGQ